MSEPIKLPSLGESVESATVTSWLKEIGEEVEVGEPIVEVSTDKVDSEVPSPVSGILEQKLVEEDDEVETGAVLGYIGDGTGVTEPAADEDASRQEAAADSKAPAADLDESGKDSSSNSSKPASSGNSTEVTLPSLGESVEEATVTSWLKEVGDEIEEGEPIVEVSTDKVDSEVPSPASGILQEIRAQEDETVSVGGVLAVIGDGSAPSEGASSAPAPEEQSAPQSGPASAPAPATEASNADQSSSQSAPKVEVTSGEPDAYITPIVRKLGKELGVDLSKVKGTGVGGRIRREDVESTAKEAKKSAKAPASKPAAAPAAPAAAAAPSAPSAPKAPASKPSEEAESLRGTTQKMTRLRQTIAKRMVESLQISAQLTTVIKVDVTDMVNLRNRVKGEFQQREGTKLTYLPFFVKATVDTLKNHPKLNARIHDEDKTVEYFDHENIGIAVDTPRGLFVPVVKNAGELNIAGIAKQINSLAAAVRNNKMNPDDLAGATFTVTSTGSNGVLFDTPVINQPEVAILGIGGIVKEPGVVKDANGNESIGIRSYVYPAITYDHRLVDGAVAGRFLKELKQRLEASDFEADL